MRCDICEEEGVEITYVDEVHDAEGDMYIIRNVPTFSCPHCSESYLTAQTMYELERLQLHHEALAEKKCVGVIEFSAVAPLAIAASA